MEQWQLYSLMHSLDQAFLARQGLAGHQGCEWGKEFFAALDARHTSWAGRTKEVYLAASHLLHELAHPHAHPLICGAITHNPRSFVRMVILLLENSSLNPNEA